MLRDVPAMWCLDFWRAFLSRPRLLRWIAAKAMGRYAYRELYGIKESLDKLGYNTDVDFIAYDLEGMDYHKDKVVI